MNILSSLAPPSSFQIGIRAVSRQSERILYTASARQFATVARVAPFKTGCCGRSTHAVGLLGPSRALRYERTQSHGLLPRTTVRTAFTFRAIVHYSLLPNDYEDANGLAYRKEDLTQTEVNKIFGAHITARDANQLLKIIHGRRVAGTLDDPDLQQNTAHFLAADKIKALEYLRKNIPVDEVINAGLRAEDELRLLEEQESEFNSQEAEEQFEETSPQKTPTAKEVEEQRLAPTGRLPRQDDSAYGEGVFDRIRKRNEAKHAAEQERLEAERIKREEEEALGNIGTLQTQQAKPRELSPFVKKYTERATSSLAEPPKMAAWERLLPTAAFVLLVLGACAVLAAYYTPPKRNWRMWPDIPPAAATCIALILGNLAVFALWKFPPAWVVFNRYMLLVAATPRPLQVIGAMFSHHQATHMIGNMVALWFFGIRLHDDIGRGNFLALYFASGAVGFLASLSNLVLFRGLQFTTLGASGAVYGIMAAFFWLHRADEFKIFGYPPDPWSGPTGAVFLGLIVGLHIWAGLFSRNAAAFTYDIASHVGGISAGMLGIEWIQKSMDSKAAAKVKDDKHNSMDVLGKVVEQKPKTDN
ncbi:hypothetical protein JX266_000372 [Neoarthrinium moseri]|nr:hypothetical protein JX266_000372 [Neoarthrinium moseri]